MSIFANKPKDDTSGLTSQIEALTDAVKALEANVQNISTSVQTLNSNQHQLSQELGALREGSLSQGNDHHYQEVASEEKFRALSEYGEDELATMSQRDQFRIMEESQRQELQKAIKDALLPVSEQFSSFQKESKLEQAKRELHEVMNERGPDGKPLRPDFHDYVKVMTAMKNESAFATLPFRNLYTLAKDKVRSENPEQYAQIEEKHYPKPKQQPMLNQPYGGILSATMPEDEGPNDMSIEDAAKAALQEHAAEHGGIPIGEE